MVSNGQIAQNGTSTTKCSFWQTMRSLRLLLKRQVVAQQTGLMKRQIVALGGRLLGEFIRQTMARPDLTVRMRIARPHHHPSILENLHRVDEREGAELPPLFSPGLNHTCNIRDHHTRQRQVMAR